MQLPAAPTLLYFYDPMCSWCWGFRPTLVDLQKKLPAQVGFASILGGLAPDSNEPMPVGMQQMLQATWQQIHNTLGTDFNFDFWQQCHPRRSTYPACRAAIIARAAGREADMVFAIQQAYYLHARNPSDTETLASLAVDIGLEAIDFNQALTSPETDATLLEDIAFTQKCGVSGFPSLRLAVNDAVAPVTLNYQTADPMVAQINQMLTNS